MTLNGVLDEAFYFTALSADRDALRLALARISEGRGRYSQDQLTHASNTVEDMKALAVEALGMSTDEIAALIAAAEEED